MNALRSTQKQQVAIPISEETQDLIASSVSDNTLRAYHGCLNALTGWLGDRTLDDVTLADYLSHLYDLGKSPSTIAQVVSAVRWRVKYSPP